jgi:hypothetical protein
MRTSLRWLRIEPFVVLMTAAWIVGLFSVSTAPLQDLWRPLGVGLAIAIVLALLAGVLPRWGRWASLVLGGAWLLALGAWPLALALVLVSAWRLGIDALRRAQGRRPVREPAGHQVARVINALAAAALIVAVLSLANSGAVRIGAGAGAVDELATPDEPPNVVLVLLDGYPSSSVLAENFGYDNRAFEAALGDRGFDVVDDSRSNYNRTLLTLSSMLHLRYVDEVPALGEPRDGFAAQTRQLTAAVNDAPVPAMFREAGYRTVTIGSSYGEATITSMDETQTTGAMTLFEEQLLRYTTLGGWIIAQQPELVADQHRAGVLGVLERVEDLALDRDEPVFALAHVFSPHTPFVFGADGSPRSLQACYPRQCGLTTPEAGRIGLSSSEYAEGLTAQVEFLNSRLLEVVDALVERDPEVVVVLFSDHGARFDEGPTDEHFRTFLATRAPGHAQLLGDSITLVNVMPSLLNAYFGTDAPMRPDRFAWAPDEAPLEPQPVSAASE